MSKEFAKIVNLYQPSGKDIREKDDQPDQPSHDSYSDLNLLPLARLCPELGKLIPHQGKEPDGPQQTC